MDIVQEKIISVRQMVLDKAWLSVALNTGMYVFVYIYKIL